jgi:hypothetical protein
LFSNSDAKYRRIPRKITRLNDFKLEERVWESLMIPINMAFFFRSTAHGKMMAFYPSPAGAVESLLPLQSWNALESRNSRLNEMSPDVEALLINRVGPARGFAGSEYYILPIDECYKLVGLIRINWRGLSGGTEVWQEITSFFLSLKKRARVHTEVTSA